MLRLTRYATLLPMTLIGVAAQATLIYSNLPSPLPPNLPSVGYQATSTTEFGDHIQFAAGPRKLDTVTLTMSNWALASTYGSSAPGYNHDVTFNIYNYANDLAAGSLIATTTLNALIPWRPVADPTCAGGTAWRSTTDNACYNGFAFNVVFDFSSQGVILPDDVVFGLAFNTNTWGNAPLGQPGPYESLNYALVGSSPSVGTDVNPDGVFWNTAHQPFLATGTAGIFGQDTLWTGYAPVVSFNASAVPEPGSLALTALALVGLVGIRRRRQS